MTDAFGCVSTCIITMPCIEPIQLPGHLPIRVTPGGTSNQTAPAGTTPVAENRPVAYVKILNLWPNPAGALMNINYESTEEADVQLRLVNTLGQVVLMKEVSAQKGLNTHELNVSKVRQGSYLVQIITAQEVHTKVVVIMRND
ncbi:MAG: T9SS type A sorting domain-containing protein [Saprospiraceae bacterium]|nr:T9SS type A sorting domain-containing protein [Saprospiraceae bacterium]